VSDLFAPAITAPASTILVVDDSPTNLQVLVRTLHGTGHRILVARDGRVALEILRRARPDLLLLDVMMPEMDGFEVCRLVKADPAMRQTAVIFLSALGEVADKVSGLQLGAVDYITKPIQAEEVLARVATHLTRQYLERELRQSRDRLEKELASAASMQRLILPARMPEHSRVEFSAFYQTSRHAGGDYYDIIDLRSDRFAVLVADVSGHGAPAAIVMAMIRAVFHTFPGQRDNPPAVLHYLNRHFEYLWDSSMFATAVYGVIDAARGTLRLSCAGHQPPLIVRADGRVEEARVDAVMSLLWSDLGEVPLVEQRLHPGDRVVFYTDGITDREAADGRMFDYDRLLAALQRIGPVAPRAIVDALVAEVDAFAGGHEACDDQTLLVVGLS
jgi:serine phosphatase RsbU (regulator of sigma subunit)